MKITKKAVGKALPTYTYLNKYYYGEHFSGLLDGKQRLLSAFAEYDSNGTVSITIYGIGEGMQRNHFYRRECIEITDLIEEYMSDETLRKVCVDTIAQLLNLLEQKVFDGIAENINDIIPSMLNVCPSIYNNKRMFILYDLCEQAYSEWFSIYEDECSVTIDNNKILVCETRKPMTITEIALLTRQAIERVVPDYLNK